MTVSESYCELMLDVIENIKDIADLNYALEYITNSVNGLLNPKGQITDREEVVFEQMLDIIKEARSENEKKYAIEWARNSMAALLPNQTQNTPHKM